MRRDSFVSCMNVVEKLRETNGLIASRISQKANTHVYYLDKCLNFLKSEGIIDSRQSEKNELYSRRVGQVYFLTERGRQFAREWNKYKIETDLDELIKQLQNLV